MSSVAQNFNRLVRNNIIHNEHSEHKISLPNFTALCVFSNLYFYLFFTGKLYSIIHDGIQKFSRELNGVMTQHTTPAMDPLTLLWSLTEIQGGSLNASKLCGHIFNKMKSIHSVQDAAAATIVKSLSQYHNSLNVPRPASYFKVCQVLHFSEETKTTQMIMLNWPTAITADGCSTNMSAGNKLVENLGLTIPFMRYDYSNKESNWEKALFTSLYRCLRRSYCIFYSFIRRGSHAADGLLKRLANSKTMNVSEVSDEFLPSFRKTTKHFKWSDMFRNLFNQICFIIKMIFFFRNLH